MTINSNKKWSYERKRLLISIRPEPDFSYKNKKDLQYEKKILIEIKGGDKSFAFTRDEITRCFLNIMSTCKRIKQRNNTSGEAATS